MAKVDKAAKKDKAPKADKATKANKPAAKPEAKADKAAKPEASKKPAKVMTLNAITKKLRDKIVAESKVAIEVAGLIHMARSVHFTTPPKKEGGKPKVDGKGFVAWCLDNFDIKKAQAYNYCAIHEVFSQLPEFHEMPVSLLRACMNDEAIMSAAQDALADGETVDLKWLKAYQEAEKAEAEAKKAAAKAEEDEEAAAAKAEREAAAKAEEERQEAYISGIEQELEETKAKLEASEAFDDSKLVKFLSKQEPHAILFVAADANKRAVNAAKRSLVAAYKGAPGVLELIEQAATAMTSK